jgi:hypothetical protein
VHRYRLQYEGAFLADLRSLRRAYDLPLITHAALQLAEQAEVSSRNRRPLRTPISWCPAATWQQRVEGYRILYRVEHGVGPTASGTIQRFEVHGGDGPMSSWHTQEEVDALVRERVSEQLRKDIAAYDGAPAAAKEILRGLAAARMMDIDLGPFEDALAEKHRRLDSDAA